MKLTFAVLRVVFGIAIALAVFVQLAHSIEFWRADPAADLPFLITNYFSFFTIDSNVGAFVVLLIGAALAFTRKSDGDPHWYTVTRAVIVTYMATTGIVYNLLLRGIELPQGSTVEWSNEILHVVGPLYLVIDWIFAPGRTPLPWSTIRTIVIFPIVWVIYTLVRGPLAIDARTGQGWYPYPFLNPATSQNGYLSVTFYVVLIALVISSVGAGVVWLSRRERVAVALPER